MTTLNDQLEQHRVMAAQLKTLKEEEMKLRVKIVEKLTKKDDSPGTKNFTREGMRVKVKLGLNYNLDQEELVSLMTQGLLTEEELGAIRTKYELKLAEYKRLDNPETLDDVIIVKPAAPTLSVELGE